jgi:RNA polymerase sigma-70 factor (ECF subfamily)
MIFPIDDNQLRKLADGEQQLAQFERLVRDHRQRLRAMVAARLDQALQKRIDASDVVQDALMIAFARLQDYLERRPMSFELWLRKTTLERLIDLRRMHYATQRDVRNEIAVADHSALVLAGRALAHQADVADDFFESERMKTVRGAVDSLDDIDREILLLRYVDGLSLADAAKLLEIEPSAASKRHGRALIKLARKLQQVEPGADG